jgi:hypothetical protein
MSNTSETIGKRVKSHSPRGHKIGIPSLRKGHWYKRYKSNRKKIFQHWYSFTKGLNWLEKTVRFQHRYFPIPLFLYDYIFRLNINKVILNFYGYHIWRYKYLVRGGNHLDYWNSKESLYWHFWRQTDRNNNIIQVLNIPEIKICLNDPSLTACEIGFGVGKYYRQHWRHNRLKEYIAVDTNKYVCEYNKKYYKRQRNLSVVNASAEDFMNSDRKFDILIASGEVFAYIEPKKVELIISKLQEKGVKTVIILEEGCMERDIVWPDGTIEYNFKERLLREGFADKHFYYQEHDNKILKYLVMC